ncbi:MAG: RNA polymerase sigma factor [Gemmataceae bacterium]
MGDAERITYESRLRVAVLAGDEVAWRVWYDACAAPLERYIRWRCGGHTHLAADVLQDTWLIAVQRIRTFDPRASNFRQWLRGIAANTIRNHLRKDKRSAGRRSELGDPASAPTSDDDRAYRIAAALAELKPAYERVLRAKYLDGRSVCAIANKWSKSPKAVESLLTRARAAFKLAYEKQTDG